MKATNPGDLRLVDHIDLATVLDVSPARVKALQRAGVLPAYRIGARQLRLDVHECLARLRARPARESVAERSS